MGPGEGESGRRPDPDAVEACGVADGDDGEEDGEDDIVQVAWRSNRCMLKTSSEKGRLGPRKEKQRRKKKDTQNVDTEKMRWVVAQRKETAQLRKPEE